MKRFLITGLKWLVILLVSSAFFLRMMVFFPNKYTLCSHEMNLIYQMERMRQINGSKIIVIGGSGCGFGLCSPMIRDYFGMPVCNTGTHAGLGLLLQLKLYKEYVDEGDMVLVIPEYENYFNNKYLGDKTVLRIFTSVYPQGYKSLSVRQQLHLIQYVPSAFNDAWTVRNGAPDEIGIYTSKSLNEEGDVERYEMRRQMEVKDWTVREWENPKLQKKVVAELQDFTRFCHDRKATMLLFPPAYKAMNYDANLQYIDWAWEALKEAQLPVASCPERYRMADTLCFDTEYHLTYEGVLLRTQSLIDDVDSYFHSQIY